MVSRRLQPNVIFSLEAAAAAHLSHHRAIEKHNFFTLRTSSQNHLLPCQKSLSSSIAMPKAPTKQRAKTARVSPTKPKGEYAKAIKDSKDSKTRDPKASHLYTDDNPSTTIHGTGFKDKATALQTLELISKRSLIYQFQTVNTLFNRAKHHPSMKRRRKDAAEGSDSTEGIRAAMEVFENWINLTYPAEREKLRAGGGFKPLLSKKCVEKYLERISSSKAVSKDAKNFAQVYCSLGKGKRLGNVLVDDSKPKEPDWRSHGTRVSTSWCRRGRRLRSRGS